VEIFLLLLIQIRSKEFLDICQGIRSGETTKIKKFYELVADESVDINTTNSSGWGPIHFLCKSYGDRDLIDMIQLLINRGANVDAKTDTRRNSLHLLCVLRRITIWTRQRWKSATNSRQRESASVIIRVCIVPSFWFWLIKCQSVYCTFISSYSS